MIRYTIIIEKTSDGGYCAYVPDLPGCVAQGSNREEVIQNIMEGIKFHLDGMKEIGLQIPEPTSEAENLVFEYA